MQPNNRMPIITPGVICSIILLLLPAIVWSEQTTDISNAVLTSRTADCATFTGTYRSKVTDHVNRRTIDGELAITADQTSCTFRINQIPNHDFGQNVQWPHTPKKNTDTLTIPRHPTPARTTTPVGLGPAAILLNGVKWEPNPAACFGEGRGAPGKERIGCGPQQIAHPWRYNIGSALNKFSFDNYHAHVQRGGMYHYHATPRVLYTQNARLFAESDCTASGPSPTIGFALDGYPLFGPCITDDTGTVRPARSSYVIKSGLRQAVDGYETPYVAGVVQSASYNGQFTGDFEYIAGSGDLDECNGATINGQYGYYATSDFPYAIRCLTGSPLMPVR